ncbi:MAG: hypothetical protein ABEK59_08885 [Halobacteria archaeon]
MRNEILEFWSWEFGVPENFLGEYGFYKIGENKAWMFDGEFDDEPVNEALGLPFLRINQEHPKPTSVALQYLGDHVSNNRIKLDQQETRRFVNGETVEQEFEVESLGYVAVSFDGNILGCGLYFPGELRSQIPKSMRVDGLLI